MYVSLSGGAIRGIMHAGWLAGIMDKIEILGLGGTSIGALIAYLLAWARATPHAIAEAFIQHYPRDFELHTEVIRGVVTGQLFKTKALMDSSRLVAFVLRMCDTLNVPIRDLTFEQVAQRLSVEFSVVVFEFRSWTSFYCNAQETPHLKVLDVIVAAMSVPGLFRPVEFDGRICFDGGVMANYAVHFTRVHKHPTAVWLTSIIGDEHVGIGQRTWDEITPVEAMMHSYTKMQHDGPESVTTRPLHVSHLHPLTGVTMLTSGQSLSRQVWQAMFHNGLVEGLKLRLRIGGSAENAQVL